MPLSEDKILTHQSDIYAFAMVAFKVFTGKQPYSEEMPFLNLQGDEYRSEFVRRVREGMRPLRSSDKQGCISDTMWTIMQNCWHHDPARRPLAAEVVSLLMNASLSLTPEKPPEPLFFLIDLVPVEGSVNAIPDRDPQPRSLLIDLHPHPNQFKV